MLKAALFDLDGTIVDSESQYTRFWGAMGQEYGVPVENFAQVIKGTTLTQIFGRYFPHDDWQRSIKSRLDQWEQDMDYQFIPGAKELVERLRAEGIMTLIVTSSNDQKMAALRKKLPEVWNLFDHIVTADQFAASKPAPDCYLTAMQIAHAEPSVCLAFEDTATGLQAAKAAGLKTVGIATTQPAEQIAPYSDILIREFSELNIDEILNK